MKSEISEAITTASDPLFFLVGFLKSAIELLHGKGHITFAFEFDKYVRHLKMDDFENEDARDSFAYKQIAFLVVAGVINTPIDDSNIYVVDIAEFKTLMVRLRYIDSVIGANS